MRTVEQIITDLANDFAYKVDLSQVSNQQRLIAITNKRTEMSLSLELEISDDKVASTGAELHEDAKNME